MTAGCAGVCHCVNRRPRPASHFMFAVSARPPNAFQVAMFASSQTMYRMFGRPRRGPRGVPDGRLRAHSRGCPMLKTARRSARNLVPSRQAGSDWRTARSG